MDTFDITIIGTGIAGSLLLLELSKSALQGKSILLIDPVKKDKNDRIISFWSDQPFPFPDIPYLSWNRINIISSKGIKKTLNISPYIYYSFESIHLYNKVKEIIKNSRNIYLVNEKVKNIQEEKGLVKIKTLENEYSSKTVFNSELILNNIITETSKSTTLFLEFSGWKIETKEKAFDINAPTLFDFRAETNGCFSFGYIIPYSEKEALIDFVTYYKQISANTNSLLQNYLENILKITDYNIKFRERGIIPLTDFMFPRKDGKHMYRIGTSGGMIKPVTGYGFTRMYTDSKLINAQLKNGVENIAFPKKSVFYRRCDSTFLKIIKNDFDTVPDIFLHIFKRNTCDHIFRFLEEKASLLDILMVLNDIPKMPIIKEAF